MSTRTTPRRPDESMTLLREMMERPLDPGYAQAARRREAAGMPRATSLRSWRVLAGAIVIGLLIGGGASVLRGSATAKAGTRAALVSQIGNARALVDERDATVRDLRSQVAALDARLLDGSGSAVSLPLEVAAGAVAVTGPGFVVTLDNGPSTHEGAGNSDPRATTSSDDTVQAADLQAVANGLWQAGAEAVAVNGQRLSATAAIRFAGEAILVDYRPLARPYVVEAVGDPRRLPAAFAEGPAGSYVATLRNTYGISVKMQVADRLVLPGATTLSIQAARPLPDGAAGSPTPRDTGSSTLPATPEPSP